MRLKARRGAVVVMLGIMVVALVSVAAVAIDFSRLWALKNELQTSADAAALAGAIQLSPPNNAANTVSVATSYATANKVMTSNVTVDAVILGDWDDVARTFTAGAAHTDAVSVTVSRQSSGLIMAMLRVPLPRLKAHAIGWADAPVISSAGCIRPVAVPFTQLMYRLNQFRGIANTPDTNGLYRRFDQVNDVIALSNMTAAQRSFTLKLGSGQVYDTLGKMSGNYQAVKLGPLRDAAGNLYSPGPDGRGTQAFREHMSGLTCHTLKVGDILETQPGLAQGQPAICGAWPSANGCGGFSYGAGVCGVIRGDANDPLGIAQSSTRFGDCEDSSGNAGVDVKAAFYSCMTGCNGTTQVEVTMLGSFTMTKIFPEDAKASRKPYSNFSKAEIQGIFKPVTDPGSVGPGSTILFKTILVK